jgi:hypothetical protein
MRFELGEANRRVADEVVDETGKTRCDANHDRDGRDDPTAA